jgi:urease accessory protein
LTITIQGSTKVFKTRPGTRAAIHRGPRCEGTTTRNEMDVTVSASGAVFLLPDPATCFRSASYVQIQTIRLAGDASVVLLDWITSGRKSLGEEWAFSRYYSVNELWVDGKRAVKDVLLLEEGDEGKEAAGGGTPRSLSAKLAPYSCYATLILYGPQVQGVIRDLSDAYKAIVVFKCAAPADLVWSLSPIASGDGCVIRVAGKETEGVKHWLRDALLRLQDLVGIDVYRRTFV